MIGTDEDDFVKFQNSTIFTTCEWYIGLEFRVPCIFTIQSYPFSAKQSRLLFSRGQLHKLNLILDILLA